jgi:hypothetical protein
VTLLGARHVVKREISCQEDNEIYTRITGVMFTNLNLDDDPIELVEEEVEGEVEIDKEDILYNPGEGYMDFEIIEETNDEVEYRR